MTGCVQDSLTDLEAPGKDQHEALCHFAILARQTSVLQYYYCVYVLLYYC